MFLLLLLVSVASAEECITACQLEYKPVCGSDGTTYSNDCQLQALSCLKKSSVYAVHQGDCIDPIVEPEAEPMCNIVCTLQWEPVCGTNAVTYGNLCQMQSDACLKRTTVAVQNVGECIEAFVEAPEPQTECVAACTYQWEPICGTNAVTYGNLCHMKSDACLKKTPIAVQYAGECAEEAPEPEPLCNIFCTLQWEPVCGTNAVTYGNLCQMQSDACMKRTSLAVQYAGQCVEDVVEAPVVEPECNTACTYQWEPVCGTDAVTYGNLCQMQSDACLKRTAVAVQYAGECTEEAPEPEPLCSIFCTLQWEPVCGTNAMTYGNLCQMQYDACVKRTPLAVQYAGQCVEEVVEAPVVEPECNTACTYQWEPVCGTDAVTYGNLCQMQSDACLKRTAVAVQYAGECAEPQAELLAPEPCNMICQMNWEPVCGSDAVTYGNLCQLNSSACLKRTPIAVAHSGDC